MKRSSAAAPPANVQIAPARTAPAIPPPPATTAASEREQIVRISIGRIRVDAPPATSAPARTPFVRPRPRLSLDEYARRRGGAP